MRAVQISVCTDATGVDLLNSVTLESVLPPEREYFVIWDIEVLESDSSWKVADITSDTVQRCGP